MKSAPLIKVTFADGSTAECDDRCSDPARRRPRSCVICNGASFRAGPSVAAENARLHGDEWIAALVGTGQEIASVERALDLQGDALFDIAEVEVVVPARPQLPPAKPAPEPEFDPAATMDPLFGESQTPVARQAA
jgi:hypothetical protein